MKKNYEIPECEEINVRVENNILEGSTTIVGPEIPGEEE